MNKYTVEVSLYKYGRYGGIDVVTINATDRAEAKLLAKELVNSTRWAINLTVTPDLRTVKQIK
jgi:hypothetical protein